MGELEEEFEYYLSNQDDLVKEYNGKYLVIRDHEVVGVYDSELDAYKDASEKYEMGTFLIQHCLPGEESHTQTFHSRVGI